MTNVNQITDEELNDMAYDIKALSNKNENYLYELIGNSLYDVGLDIATSDNQQLVKPAMWDSAGNIKISRAVRYVMKTEPLIKEKAKTKGKKFWKRFKISLQNTICNNPQIVDILSGNVDKLKQGLKTIIPIILSVLGLTLCPPALAIIASAIALILKVGINVYCKV